MQMTVGSDISMTVLDKRKLIYGIVGTLAAQTNVSINKLPAASAHLFLERK